MQTRSLLILMSRQNLIWQKYLYHSRYNTTSKVLGWWCLMSNIHKNDKLKRKLRNPVRWTLKQWRIPMTGMLSFGTLLISWPSASVVISIMSTYACHKILSTLILFSVRWTDDSKHCEIYLLQFMDSWKRTTPDAAQCPCSQLWPSLSKAELVSHLC